MIHYVLAEYFESRTGDDAALMTEAVCIAWNAVVRRRSNRRNRDEYVLASIGLRGTRCDLVEDYSHIWGRDFEHEENRILSHFEKLLREWAAAGDGARLNAALDAFARRNRTSLMWSVFMEAGLPIKISQGRLQPERPCNVRRILLAATTDPVPHARDDNDERDDWPGWG